MRKTNERGRPKKEEGTKIVALRLPESLVELLIEEAKKTGLPLATYCKIALMRHSREIDGKLYKDSPS